MTVSSDVRYVHSHFIITRTERFETKSVLHVDAIFWINGENHATELFVILDGQVFFVFKVLGIKKIGGLRADVELMKQNLAFYFWSFALIVEDAIDASFGQFIFVIPAEKFGPHIHVLIFF